MPLTRPFVAFVLLTAAALPQLLGLGAHLHELAEETTALHLAAALVHGHEHAEGVPAHEHNLLPSPPFRQDPPRDLPAPAVGSLEALDAEHLVLSHAGPWQGRIRPPGSSPPRLHLLCTLLI